MKQETCILPTIAAVTTTSAVIDPVTQKPLNGISADINCTEADVVAIYAVPALGVGETVGIFLTDPSGTNINLAALFNPNTNAAFLLDNTHQSQVIPGGFLIRLVKSGTAAPTGIYYAFKPRTGN
jgi:hypothetical protein